MNTGCSKSESPDEVWGLKAGGPQPMVYPRGLTYSSTNDEFYVVDRMARIQRLDNHGRFLNEWQMPDWHNGKPTGLSAGPDGLLYVADTHYQRIIVYRPDGTEVRRWGKSGRGDGEFIFPTDIAFDSKGRIFVSEYGDNDRIQAFDSQGNYLYQFGHFGMGDGELSRPQSMVIDGDTLYLTDACNHRIGVWTTDGKFLRNMGGTGSALGDFRFPYGLDQDDQGHLIVCEFGNNRVQLIEKATGKGIRTWGHGGRAHGELAYPWAAVFDRNGRTVVIDSGNNRIQVFRF